MTKKDRLHNWRRLAKATTALIDCEDASSEVVDAVLTFCDDILPTEHSDTYYVRRLIKMGEDIARERPRSASDDIYEEWCQEWGSALSDILKDERTPDCVGEAAAALYDKLDAAAAESEPQLRRVAQMNTMLPELLILATYEFVDRADNNQNIDELPSSAAVM